MASHISERSQVMEECWYEFELRKFHTSLGVVEFYQYMGNQKENTLLAAGLFLESTTERVKAIASFFDRQLKVGEVIDCFLRAKEPDAPSLIPRSLSTVIQQETGVIPATNRLAFFFNPPEQFHIRITAFQGGTKLIVEYKDKSYDQLGCNNQQLVQNIYSTTNLVFSRLYLFSGNKAHVEVIEPHFIKF